jgi:hypothetical protein
MLRSKSKPTLSGSADTIASLGCCRLRLFGFTPTCKARLLAPVVRTGFQFIVLTSVAVEENDLLCGLMLRLRHGVWPSGILGSIEPAFWPRDAEVSASSDASASCYGFTKNVRVLPVVVAELKLIQVQRKVLFADVVIGADNPALEQRPEAFDVVGMDFAANVLILRMLDGFVRQPARRLQIVITTMIVCRYEAHAVAYSLADESVQSFRVRVLYYLANHVAFPADGSDDAYLTGADPASDVRFLVPMSILILPADESFIDFDNTHKLLEIVIAHTSTEPMADVPCGMQRRTLAEEHATKLTRRNAFFALQHGVENLEPRYERNVRILEDCSDGYGEPIGRFVLIRLIPAKPIEWSGFGCVDLFIAAFRTDHFAVRPATVRKILTASRFVPKHRHKLLEGHHA